jgi:hypothetical protein
MNVRREGSRSALRPPPVEPCHVSGWSRAGESDAPYGLETVEGSSASLDVSASGCLSSLRMGHGPPVPEAEGRPKLDAVPCCLRIDQGLSNSLWLSLPMCVSNRHPANAARMGPGADAAGSGRRLRSPQAFQLYGHQGGRRRTIPDHVDGLSCATLVEVARSMFLGLRFTPDLENTRMLLGFVLAVHQSWRIHKAIEPWTQRKK